MNKLLKCLIWLFYLSKSRSFILSYLGCYGFKILSVLCGVDMSCALKVGRSLKIHHGFGLVIHQNAILGDNVTLRNGVTIGVKKRNERNAPVISDNVDIGANAVILGDVRVGAGAVIGAGSVVLSDIGQNEVWAGNPAKRIK